MDSAEIVTKNDSNDDRSESVGLPQNIYGDILDILVRNCKEPANGTSLIRQVEKELEGFVLPKPAAASVKNLKSKMGIMENIFATTNRVVKESTMPYTNMDEFTEVQKSSYNSNL